MSPTTLGLVLAAYAVGSIPTAYWLGRVAYGKDLRSLGSCNLGATNALRVLGWRAALPVFFVDVSKGFLPAGLFAGLDAQTDPSWALVYGGSAILGHVFSLWVRFRGGKGVATGAGVLIAVAPHAAVVGVVTWLAIAGITRTVSVASVVAAVIVGVTGWMLPLEGSTRVFLTLVAVVVTWAHRSNLRRLCRGEEPRFSWTRRSDGQR